MKNKYIIILIIVLIIIYLNYSIKIHFTNTENDFYLINLDRRRDRLNKTIGILNKYGFNDIIRFSAIDSSKYTVDDFRKYVDPSEIAAILRNYRKREQELSKGAVGCYLSHLSLWKNMVNNNKSRMFVFEDDTLPTFNKKKLDYYIKQVPDDCDILIFGGIYKKKYNVNTYITGLKDFWCLHGYMIRNTSNVKKAIIDALPMRMQIDAYLCDLAQKNELNIYGILHNRMWMQNPEVNTTDIQIPMKNKLLGFY